MDATASARVTRFDYPHVTTWISLLELLVVAEEVTVFIWQDVSIWHEIKSFATVFLLCLDVIEAESILSRYLVRVWEMIEPLVLVKSLVQVCFTATTCPQKIPLVRLRIRETICFAQTTNQFGIAFQDFI